jgi:signal transduction histidine kinase
MIAAEAPGVAPTERLLMSAAAALGFVLTGLAVGAVVWSDQPGDHTVIALASGLAVAVPVAVGLWVWRAGEHARFGKLLVLWGLIDFVPVLSYSSEPELYSVGRIGVWLVQPVSLAAVLAFPSGRVRARTDRAIVLLMAATVAFLYLPTALLVDRYPEPALWTTCRDSCPDNAFQVVASEPAFVESWVRPLREGLTVLAFLLVVVVLARRLRASSALARRLVAPVLAVAIVRSAAMVAGLPIRQTVPDATEVFSWIYVLSLPALAVAFFVGIVRSQLVAGTALQQLALRLRREKGAGDVREVLAETLDDPTLAVAYWLPDAPGRWVDAAGKDVRLPSGGSRAVTEVREDGRRIAALVHDPALREQGSFVEAAGSFALAVLENERLRAQVDASLEDLRESRARIQAAADSERRRIERDLHDGAQQRLVALRVRLELAAETVRDDPDDGARVLRELGAEAEELLDEVRSLAQGIYPSLLADRGLEDALREIARRASVPVALTTDNLGRYPAEVEAAVYFCALEALQNVAKHAPGARNVSLTVHGDGDLRFEIRDDGPGFRPGRVAAGRGLTNMHDRLAAVGGRLAIDSESGRGTAVSGSIPLTADGPASPG